ncbi:hypothetical protein JCM19992_26420 [Thermostilla marina]
MGNPRACIWVPQAPSVRMIPSDTNDSINGCGMTTRLPVSKRYPMVWGRLIPAKALSISLPQGGTKHWKAEQGNRAPQNPQS